ncbi:hypothetical protein ABZX72_29500 [Streptomyces cyaneofuscatus]|uniref:hypothetical protein n=1 Tax=Streptomyces cyaneofuscatus TaxID=66883 RepID=UPI0033A03AD8
MDKLKINCAVAIEGRTYAAQMAVDRSLWYEADDQWRAEFLDTCRLRFAAHIRRELSTELTEKQVSDVIVVVADPREPTPAPTVLVTLHGGPLDGSTAPVDPTDDDPWTAIISEGCAYPGGRSLYAPDHTGRWVWRHDVPWEAL